MPETVTPPIESLQTFSTPEQREQDDALLLKKDIVRDFYQTFRLAQGKSEIQPPLFTMLAEKYRLHYDESLIIKSLHYASSSVDTLMPPRRHADTTSDERDDWRTGFRAMWGQYGRALRGKGVEEDRPITDALVNIMSMDVMYQSKPRPNRTSSDDVHESIFREYILGDKLSGSDIILSVRDDLRVAFNLVAAGGADDEISSVCAELINSWEGNHPGESFVRRRR